MKLLTSITVLAFAAIAGAASAATATFDFTGSNVTDAPSLSFTSDDGNVDVTITGSTYSTNGDGTFNAGAALGVDQYYTHGLYSWNGWGDAFQVDSRGPDEALNFSFSTEVSITNITLAQVTGPGYYDIFVDVAGLGNSSGGSNLPTGAGTEFAISASAVYQPCWLGSRWNCRADSGFKVKSITFDYDVSEVPLPAGGLLLLTGLAGICVARRHKRT